MKPRTIRATELAEDMEKIGKYLLVAKGTDLKALDFLHLLLMESYQKVTGER